VAIVIFVTFIILIAYATLKTPAYSSKGGLPSSSDFALAKTPFKS
jgi:hypothetical protein